MFCKFSKTLLGFLNVAISVCVKNFAQRADHRGDAMRTVGLETVCKAYKMSSINIRRMKGKKHVIYFLNTVGKPFSASKFGFKLIFCSKKLLQCAMEGVHDKELIQSPHDLD